MFVVKFYCEGDILGVVKTEYLSRCKLEIRRKSLMKINHLRYNFNLNYSILYRYKYNYYKLNGDNFS